MDWEKNFAVTNNSGMIVIAGVLEIPHGSVDYIVDPTRHPETAISSLKIFERRGTITVTNDFKKPNNTMAESDVVRKVQSASNDIGDTYDHFVFDPMKDSKSAIAVNEIDMSGSSILVEEIDSSGKGIVVNEQKIVADKQITREEAIELLNSHWKKVESEIKKIDDLKKLNYLQVVAIELGVADKKKQIIQDRLDELQ